MCSLRRVTLSLAAASAHHGTLSPQVRLEALIGVGFDLSGALDEYGQNAVFLSAAYGHSAALRLLLRLGLSAGECR